ncbi:MAG: hypothetical protein AAGB46_13360 [Verrucomicrobiota bacterium]
MEWHIAPIARKSFLSEKDFEKDDRVMSILVRGAEEALRIDVLEEEESDLELPGEPICRWTQNFKPKRDDGKEELEAMKLTADNLFIALFEGEEGPSEENAKLKYFLALMLERRRLLRLKTRGKKFNHYVHRPSKKDFYVPLADLDPEFFLENEEKLAFLVGEDLDNGGAPEIASEGEPAKKSD